MISRFLVLRKRQRLTLLWESHVWRKDLIQLVVSRESREKSVLFLFLSQSLASQDNDGIILFYSCVTILVGSSCYFLFSLPNHHHHDRQHDFPLLRHQSRAFHVIFSLMNKRKIHLLIELTFCCTCSSFCFLHLRKECFAVTSNKAIECWWWSGFSCLQAHGDVCNNFQLLHVSGDERWTMFRLCFL